MPSIASGPNATCALKVPSVPSSSAFKIPSPFKSSGIVIAPIRSAGKVSTVTVISASATSRLPCASTASAWMVTGPSPVTGIAAVMKPFARSAAVTV